MRIILKITTAVLFGMLLLGSCGWCHNHIKPSPKDLVFGAQADSATITTQSVNWWITGIYMDDSVYQLHVGHDSLTGCCFTVAKRGKILFVKIAENHSVNIRVMMVILEAGDCFSEVHVKQLGQ
jgi:hypothetical protein